MTVWDMPSDEASAINWYLGGHSNRAGWVQASSFRALLRDARGATGRNLDTGEVDPQRDGDSASWLGALGYLVLLDQVGGVLRTPDTADLMGARDLITALQVFAADDVNDDERYALYALRCPLAHDYTLYNEHDDPRLNHHFNLNPEPDAPLVVIPPPDRRWNGLVGRDLEGDATVVGLRRLGDLAETIVRRLKQAADDDLRIAPSVGGPEALIVRYSFQFWERG